METITVMQTKILSRIEELKKITKPGEDIEVTICNIQDNDIKDLHTVIEDSLLLSPTPYIPSWRLNILVSNGKIILKGEAKEIHIAE